MSLKIISIVGNRPQLIKLYPIIRAIRKPIEHLIIHTGQHYDKNLNEIFFKDLEIPNADYNLNVGSGSHCWQMGEGIKRIESVLTKENPDWVLIYGDTNSTLVGALASAKLHIPVAHVEAGLRSYDMNMPEEINRRVADICSSVLFCPTATAVENLKKEGCNADIINSGDVMYDALLLAQEKAGTDILNILKIESNSYYLATIHRPENVDDKIRLKRIIEILIKLSESRTVIFPVHPRTEKKLINYNLRGLQLISPLGYFDMLMLLRNAKKVLTDSGGLQKEAYLMKTPCITIRENTEWPETLKGRWNILTGINEQKIINAILTDDYDLGLHTPGLFGNGRSAYKIMDYLTTRENLKCQT